ncbi:MAG: SGNH/GDSL hydrolase family protein [Clostridia bacterium]|nr:SGNH/GDSL hydrolase family protein [Clostridia bacterium]MBQ7075209.1 SGNH/GDSL hydrolase family protein [Clostridia bacterium]MBQ9998033.1 SGNH/GDSL hydrolase family protein [Clostridia bacterium]
MKNLLLIGDSIRMGYDKSVKKTLEGKANVIFPDENCRFASYVLRHFHEYLNDIKGEDIDVIHWNAGLWDCLRLFEEEPQTPIDVYAYYIERICLRIKKICPNARVIFATSTKVLSEKMSKDFKRYNEEIEKYNETAVKIVGKYGFKVNDLYALSVTLPEEVHSDAVHYYTPAGTEAFTNQVLSFVVPELGINESLEYREEMYTDKPIGI